MTEICGHTVAGEVLVPRRDRLDGRIHSSDGRERPFEAEAPEWPKLSQRVLHLEQDAEVVAGAAPHGPEEILVLVRAGCDDLAIGTRHLNADHLIAIHPVHKGRERIATALHVASDADGFAASSREVQSKQVELRVHATELGSSTDGRDLPPLIDTDVADPADVDDHSIVHREPSDAVPTRSAYHVETDFLREAKACDDIAEPRAKHDDLREVLEGAHEPLPIGAVTRILRKNDATHDLTGQAGKLSIVELQLTGARERKRTRIAPSQPVSHRSLRTRIRGA
jgi:hypothetical protein